MVLSVRRHIRIYAYSAPIHMVIGVEKSSPKLQLEPKRKGLRINTTQEDNKTKPDKKENKTKPGKKKVTYAEMDQKDCKLLSNDTRDIVGRRKPSYISAETGIKDFN